MSRVSLSITVLAILLLPHVAAAQPCTWSGVTETCSSGVGVGTTTPSFKLDSWTADSNTTFLGSAGQIALNLVNNGAPVNGWSTLTFARSGGQSVYAAIGAQFVDITAPKTELVFGTGTSAGVSEKMRISSDGYLGLGTSTPATFGAFAIRKYAILNGKNVSASFSDAVNSTLDFRHPSAAVADISSENSSLTFSTSSTDTNGVERMRITPAGYIGFGTSTPATYAAFAVRESVAINSKNVSASFSDALNSTLDIRHPAGGVADISSENSALTFSTSPTDTNGIERMRITNDGRVIITGNLTVSGSITGATVVNAVYQDVAEWVPSGTQLSPGTVVVLDPQNSNQVMPSHKAYDTTVAGVVSAQPGVILGRADDTKSKIATVGRVRVRVDARQHPVHIGDLLVTSDVPGFAMVSEPVDLGGVKIHRPGTLIGKALEPLNGGEGDVLVLLSLQ